MTNSLSIRVNISDIVLSVGLQLAKGQRSSENLHSKIIKGHRVREKRTFLNRQTPSSSRKYSYKNLQSPSATRKTYVSKIVLNIFSLLIQFAGTWRTHRRNSGFRYARYLFCIMISTYSRAGKSFGNPFLFRESIFMLEPCVRACGSLRSSFHCG